MRVLLRDAQLAVIGAFRNSNSDVVGCIPRVDIVSLCPLTVGIRSVLYGIYDVISSGFRLSSSALPTYREMAMNQSTLGRSFGTWLINIIYLQ